jgi:hypothetical protein
MIAKVLAFIYPHGIQIPDLPTNIPDLGALFTQQLNKTLILNLINQ